MASEAPTTEVPRVQAIVGTSMRLREEALVQRRQAWVGPVQHLTEPEDVQSLLYGLDTPPLFGEPGLVIVRSGERWLRTHAETLAAQVALSRQAGALVLVVPALDQRTALAKALIKAEVLVQAGPPEAKQVLPWLLDRLTRHPQGVQEPHGVAQELIERVGTDADALLQAIDVLAVHAGDVPMAPADAVAVLHGVGQKPMWDLTGAVLSGDAAKAIALLYAGEVEPEAVLAALIAELRRLAACCESQDDAEVARWTGSRGNLFHARRRAQELGRRHVLRLLHGALQVQRAFRTSGGDPLRDLEIFVLHARRLLKGSLAPKVIGQLGRTSRLPAHR